VNYRRTVHRLGFVFSFVERFCWLSNQELLGLDSAEVVWIVLYECSGSVTTGMGGMLHDIVVLFWAGFWRVACLFLRRIGMLDDDRLLKV
jgi:hypothetical protein